MQLNDDHYIFLDAIISGDFNTGVVNGMPTDAYLAQLPADLLEIYTELSTHPHFASHPQAMFYLALADIVEGQPGVAEPVWLWLRGAAEVNIGEGSQAVFIRDYNKAQAEARYGSELTDAEMTALLNDISNTMADLVFEDIFDDDEHQGQYLVPDIDDLATNDASAAAGPLFLDDLGGWAGNPLFLALGYDQAFTDNILEDETDTYDALAMIKFTKESFGWANLWDAAVQYYEYPESEPVVAEAQAKLSLFLGDAYGLDPTEVLLYATVSSSIQVGRLDQGDTLHTTEASDIIHGGAGDDNIVSGFGSDYANPGLNELDLIDGGEGIDSVSFSNDIATSEIANTRTEIGLKLSPSIPPSVPYGATIAYGSIDEPFYESAIIYDIEKLQLGSSDDYVTLIGETSLSEIDAMGNSDGGGDTLDLTDLEKLAVSVDMTTGQLVLFGAGADDQEIFYAKNFENIVSKEIHTLVIGTDDDNIVVTGTGDDVIEAKGGDDLIYLGGGVDFVDGGAGEDRVVLTEKPAEINPVVVIADTLEGGTMANVETIVGSDANDQFNVYTTSSVRIAGGAGDDVFEITSAGNGQPTIVWGGAGKDTISLTTGGDASVGILVVEVDNLSEDNFHLLNLDDLGLHSSFDWSQIDVVIVNPDEDDVIQRSDGLTFGVFEVSRAITDHEFTTGSVNNVLSMFTYEAGYDDEDIYDIDGVVATVPVTFLTPSSGITYSVQSTGVSIYINRTTDPDMPSYAGSVPDYIYTPAGESEAPAYYYYIDYIAYPAGPGTRLSNPNWENRIGYDTLDELIAALNEEVEDEENTAAFTNPWGIGPWFVLGGAFDGTDLEADGSINITLPNAETIQISGTDDADELTFNTGAGIGHNVDAGDGDDNIATGDGNDIVAAGGGKDIVRDGAGNDTVDGGAGDDRFYAGDGSDHYIGGEGHDRISYENETAGLILDLTDTSQSTGVAQGDTYEGVERLIGTDYDDIIVGNGIAHLRGEGGDDLIIDGAEKNFIKGGSGADTFQFIAGDGHQDLVYDYELGTDVLDLSLWGVTSISELGFSDGPKANTLLISFGEESIRLNGYSSADAAMFMESDFIFA